MSVSDRSRHADRIREIALGCGFQRAGIATIGPSVTGRAFARWIEEGAHADMGYLERHAELRMDPRTLLPSARSVLCLAIDYVPATGSGEPSGDFWPGVARYARGNDYHAAFREKLGKVKDSIVEAFPGCEARACVDTAPLLEREWAARAGLGAFGKNTNLLHPTAGSFFLLAELLLSLELTPNLPVADLCGDCTRCLDACPTGALTPYRLESSRCISYWTIENRSDIPPEIREGMGKWVFGCDICQEVCPWNSDPVGDLLGEFATPPSRRDLDLAGVLCGDEVELRSRLRGTPLMRPKLEGLRRNAAIAMGNLRNPGYVEPLAEALESGSPMLRRHCAWALGKIGTAEAKEILRQADLRDRVEPDPEQSSAASATLGPL
ncbi:MAG: tRNA epoxyqueuosine(34) reductase QueG [Thermoanaerobaculia bacterium]